MLVIDEARDELLPVTVADKVSTLEAIDEENVVLTDPTLLIDAANEELFA